MNREYPKFQFKHGPDKSWEVSVAGYGVIGYCTKSPDREECESWAQLLWDNWRCQNDMPEWKGTDEELEEEMLDAQGWAEIDRIMGLTDEVNHPDHYTAGGIEALDVLRAKLTPEEYRGYLKGNILKYLLRANFKGAHDKDIGKSAFYARELDDATQKTTA